MSTCIRMCCGRKDCDVAFMLEANCYAVNCYNEDLCQPVLARKSGLLTNLSPKLSYITARDEEGIQDLKISREGLQETPSVLPTYILISRANNLNSTVGSIKVSGILPTYPSPKPISAIASHLGQNVGLGEGQVVSYPETYNDPINLGLWATSNSPLP